MIEKIIHMIFLLLGAITFSILLVFTVTSIAEKIQIKIKQGKDPKTNIKHINRLLHKIQKEGKKVIARGGSVQAIEKKKDKYLELYSVFEIALDDEEGN